MTHRRLRWLGIAALLIGYPLLARRSPQRIFMLGLLVLACAAWRTGWSALQQHFGLVSWLQYLGMRIVPFIWSVFDNFLTLPLVALMFIAEHWVRRRVFPKMRHAHILDAVWAYRYSTARPAYR